MYTRNKIQKCVCVHELVLRNDYCAIRNMFGWVGNTHTYREDDSGRGRRGDRGGWVYEVGMNLCLDAYMQWWMVCKWEIYASKFTQISIYLNVSAFFPLILSITTGIVNMAYSLVFTLFSLLLDTGELDKAKGLSFINSESNNIQLGRTV